MRADRPLQSVRSATIGSTRVVRRAGMTHARTETTASRLGATYSTNFTALPWEWRLASGLVDGVPVIVHWRLDGEAWRPHAAIRLWWRDGTVVRIRDYIHVDYLLTDWAVPSGPVAPTSAPPR